MVLRDLPFRQNQPLKLADDKYIGKSKNKIKTWEFLNKPKSRNIRPCDLN
jgi:hypothetical protein